MEAPTETIDPRYIYGRHHRHRSADRHLPTLLRSPVRERSSVLHRIGTTDTSEGPWPPLDGGRRLHGVA